VKKIIITPPLYKKKRGGVFVVFMHRIPYNRKYSYKVVVSFKGVKYDGII